MCSSNSADFTASGQWNRDEFRGRVLKYEALTESLACMVGILGRWGDGTELPLVLDILRSIHANAEKVGAGLMAYVNIRSYPAVLIFAAYGLGLTRAERWSTLHDLFNAILDDRNHRRSRVVENLFLTWKGTEQNVWKQIEGLEQLRTPLSDYLLKLFSEWSKRFVGLTPDFELVFERFEILGSLGCLSVAPPGIL